MDINTTDTGAVDTKAAMHEAAKECSKVGMLTALQLAQATGVPQGFVVALTATAALGSLFMAGASDEQIATVINEAKRAAGEAAAERGLSGMVPAGNA